MRGYKFGPVSSQGVLLGFDEDNFNYHIYGLGSHTIIITHHATFNENCFPFKDQLYSSSPSSPPVNSGVKIQFFDDESDEKHFEDVTDEQLSTVPPKSPDTEEHALDPSVTKETVGTGLPRRSDRVQQPVIRYTSTAVCDDMKLLSIVAKWELYQTLDCGIPACGMVTGAHDVQRSYSKAVNGLEDI